MRFSHHTAKELFDRSALKLAVFCLSIVLLMLGIFLVSDVSKTPIIVERACETTLLETGSSTQTQEEVQTFVKEALGLRFDSQVAKDPAAYLVQDLLVSRIKEQDELKKSGIDQRLIVRAVKIDGDHFLVDADRLIAVGKVRSALPTILLVKISSKGRSLTNPYGLVLTSVDQQKVEGKKND